MRLRYILPGGLVLALLVVPIHSEAPEWTGYFKNFNAAYRTPDQPDGTPGRSVGSASGRLRSVLGWKATSWLTASAAYDLSPRFESGTATLGFLPSLEASRRSYRLVDFRNRIDSPEAGDRFGLFHNLDRANLQFRLPGADLTVGRQAVAWGSGRFVNPTDLLAPFAYGELDVEDRVGVDAVRLRIPLGGLGELDSGYVFGRDARWDSSAAFIRSRFNWRRTDLTGLALVFQENLLLGVDIARPLGGAGWWLEAGQVMAGAVRGNRDTGQDYLRLTTGLDYTLRNGTYLFAEYHFSGAGTGDSSGYLSRFSRLSLREGAVYFLARHYVGTGISRQLTPLLTVGGQVLGNLDDGSLLLAPNLDYNLAENLYVGAGGYLGVGQTPGPGVPFRSEFGTYPDFLFVSVRLYY